MTGPADIVSPEIYIGFLTTITAGLALVWAVVDVTRLRRALREDRASPIVRDRIFGSIVGLAISALGVVGVLRYYL